MKSKAGSILTAMGVPFAGLSSTAGAHTPTRRTSLWRGPARLLLALGGASVALIVTATAAMLPPPVQTYFVPLREANLFTSFDTINPDDVSGFVDTTIGISVAAEGTIIYYDESEDGYEVDVTSPVLTTSKIWGDGVTTNGVAPGDDGDDVLESGQVIILRNQIPIPRDESDFFYDGSDRIQATFPIAVTRAAFPENPGSLLAGATEVRDTTKYGMIFVVPFGEDTPNTSGTNPFQYTGLYVMASQDNTSISVNGGTPFVVSAGASGVIQVDQGDNVVADKPVQAHLVTGDINSTYEMRWYSLAPREDWSNDYWTPVGDETGNTKVWLYNPNNSSITVSYDFQGGGSPNGTIFVPANGTALSPTIPDDSGARFFTSGANFFGVTQTDANGSGQIYDWGHPLEAAEELSSQAVVGIGFGNTSNSSSIDSRSVVWVTPIANADIHIDFDGDGVVDNSVSASALESIMVLDDTSEYSGAEDDQDMSGAFIFADAPGPGGARVDVVMAWGQDPDRSFSGDGNALDLGTLVPPLPEVTASKTGALFTDADGDGVFGPCDTFEYTITIVNSSGVAIPSHTLNVIDFTGVGLDMFENIDYVSGSTKYAYDSGASTSAVPDDTVLNPPDTEFPLDEGGVVLTDEFSPLEVQTITFLVTIKNCSDLMPGTVDLTNTGELRLNVTDVTLVEYDVTIPLSSGSAPIISCPADVTIECDEDCTPTGTAMATSTDSCDTNVVVTFSDSIAAGACPAESVITRTWTATDACSNSSSCVQTITVVDTSAPALTVPGDVTVECDADTTSTATGTATASDNCSDVAGILIGESDVTTPGGCPNEFTITRTWTATDECGNETSADQIITVVDTTAPVLTVPADTTLECSDDCSSAATGVASATDNCSATNDIIIVENDVTTPGRCPSESTITRTWIATDECGNEISADQIITVVDTTSPVLTVPADATVECSDDNTSIATGMASATDNCSASTNVVIGESDVISDGDCPNEYVITRTWTATDECGNITNENQTITVVDTTPPVLTVPADTTVECSDDGSSGATGMASATDNCSATNDIEIVESDVISDGDCPNAYVITRTWTATDECSNSVSQAQTITVVDTTPPVLTVPADTTVECSDDNSSTAMGVASATDNCSTTNDIEIVESDVISDGDCPNEYVITRTWTATDECSNSVSQAQTITVVDTAPPVLTVPADTTVECSDDNTSAATGMASATDNCTASNDIEIVESDVISDGDCPNEYVITRTWTATDECSNSVSQAQTITVVDTTPPVLTVPADTTVECSDDSSSAATGVATATDNCSATNDIKIVESDVISDGDCPNEYVITRTWTATDECSNSVSQAQTITVVDTTPPVLTVPADTTVECSDDNSSAATGMASATDNCSATIDIQIVESDVISDGDCPNAYVITRTWTATDECSNSVSQAQTITVVDTTRPEITCPADMTFECDGTGNSGEIDAWLVSVRATDNCSADGAITVTNDFTGLGDDCRGSGTATVTFTATDECGNSTNCTALLTLIDSTPPVITCPIDATFECDGLGNIEDIDAWLSSVTATDECGAVTFTNDFVELSDDCGGTGSATVLFTAMDACGNSATCSATVTVVDTMAPALTVPADITLECDMPTEPIPLPLRPPLGPGFASAVDDCDAAPIVTWSDVVEQGDCPSESVITRTWTATDECSNSVSQAQTITVVDTTPPVLTVPADTTVECSDDNSSAATGMASATDNCSATNDIEIVESDVISDGDCPNASVITRTWTATDECSNSVSQAQTITVVDTTPPVLTVPVDTTADCSDDNSSAATGVASATDNCSATNAIEIVESDVISDGDCPNAYVITRTWTATDECSNSVSQAQTVTVVDTTPPVLTVPADTTVECSDDNSSAATGVATATDNCTASNAIVIVESDVISDGDCPNEYVITRTWTATDECSNSVSQAQTITVVDTTPPDLTVPPDATLECGESTEPFPQSPGRGIDGGTGAATAIDNCDQDPQVTWSDSAVPGDCPQEQTITRTWTATDACGNSTNDVQTITVVDTTQPMLLPEGCPDPPPLFPEGDPLNPSDCVAVVPDLIGNQWITSTDNCDNEVSLTQLPEPGSLFTNEVTITIIAVDDCGNTNTCEVTQRCQPPEPFCDAIAVVLFADDNNDGILDEGLDVRLEGVLVRLFEDGQEVDAVVSDGQGVANFVRNVGGMLSFEVDESTIPDDLALGSSFTNPTDPFFYDPFDSSSCSDVLIGFRNTCDICGVVWFDTNANGIPDENLEETGINGVRVFLEVDETGLIFGETNTSDGICDRVFLVGDQDEIDLSRNIDNGQIPGVYIFENVPEDVYNIVVDVSTVPPDLSDFFPETPEEDLAPPTLTTLGSYVLICDERGETTPDDEDPNFGFIQEPTAIELMSFEATPASGGVLLTWRTAIEIDNLGFNIYRADSLTGARTRVNSQFIRGSGNSFGQSYQYFDGTASTGSTYYYWLEDIDWSAVSTMNGPIVVNDVETIASGRVSAGGVYRLSQETLAAAGIAVNADEIGIYIDGREVAALSSVNQGPMEAGDAMLFYVPDDGASIEVRRVASGLRMEEVDATPVDRSGDIWTGAADELGRLDVPTDPGLDRHLLIGFTSPPVLIFDVSIPEEPKLLTGYAVLEVEGELGTYLSYPTDTEGACLAIDQNGITELSLD